MNKINTRIDGSDLTIIPEIALDSFGRVNAFDIRVICNPAFRGSDKELMINVCRFISGLTDGKVELKTFYVAQDVRFDAKHCVKEITFQVITPLDPQWYC